MGSPNQERTPENLRKQLAVAARSIQWSYAIFWSLSSTQQGLLEWGEGYYNGDIKTRKTIQSEEVNADRLGLQRSRQLKELYESLLEGESELGGNKRPSAALSPEDLSDLEWYYLVCMSFVFRFGEGLPGRALTSGRSIWLCNAQEADSKVFSRSLLAKSAAIQTVICFPHAGGVIEMGVNDLVLEDNNLIQHIKTSLLEFGKPDCSEKSADLHGADYDKDGVCANTTNVDHETLDRADFASLYPTTEEIEFNREMVNELVPEEFNMASPDDCSKGCCRNQQAEDSFMLDGNNTAFDSPVQTFRLIDEEDNDTDEDELLSLCIQDSFISDGCISQAFASQERTVSSPPQAEIANNLYEEIQDCNDTRFSSLELGNDEDLHYKRTVAVVLKTSGSLVKDYSASISSYKSSFIEWKEEGRVGSFRSRSPHNILKKIFSVVPKMHGTCPVIPKDNGNEPSPHRPEANKTSVLQNSTEKRRESQKYSVLRSLVPSRSEEDKTSILNSTIDYLKELEARVEELESCINQAESDSRIRKKYPDIVEQTSDNCDDKRGADTKKPLINKRKASDIDENDPEFSKVLLPGNLRDLKVSITDKEVLIEMRCHSREYILLDVMEALSNLTLDTHTVQSSTLDGILSLTLKSQFRGAAVASVGMIKQKLRRTIGMC